MSAVMYARRAAEPLSINTKPAGKGGVYATATFQYSEDPGLQTSGEDLGARPAGSNTNRHRAGSRAGSQQPVASAASTASMSNYAPAPSPPGMYVRALYDYKADDRTSLSFRKGEIIQVITQLESGWWDGIIHNVRGWFPSNYCAIISGPEDLAAAQESLDSVAESDASGTESEWEEPEPEIIQHNGEHGNMGTSSFPDNGEGEEEAAFWIPQATSDGRLYYYNTLTGVATTELPLEAPTSNDETGPRDRMNISAPDQTRAPADMEQTDYAPTDDEAEAYEVEEAFQRGVRRRRSYISDGASPTASMEDLQASGYLPRNQSIDFQRPERSTSMAPGLSATSFISDIPIPMRQQKHAAVHQSYYEDAATPPLTWNRLVENMERAVAAYKDAVNNAERSEYVRKAEDISDHLRMLLAAGSGTTDNHSGNPSIISTNKALYPHFRDMMSKFSKLVLSSHIAAADWPAPDSYSKCLQEAEGVLHGVYGYVEVARSQRGDDLPRLKPGFILGSSAGGSWRSLDNQNQAAPAVSTSFMEQEDLDGTQEVIKLDGRALENLDDLRSSVTLSLTRLEAHLLVREKIITVELHESTSNAICAAARRVVEAFKTYITAAEHLDIDSVRAQDTQVSTFLTQKQVLYDLIANLIVACPIVAGPLSDEWADVRGDSFENRLQGVNQVSKQLEAALTQITSTLHGILELAVSESPSKPKRTEDIHGNLERAQASRVRSASRTYQGAPFSPNDDLPETRTRRDTSKLQKFFGEVPAPLLQSREQEETPPFLRLDFEGELAYDQKVTPPQLRGGTLTALVEQLTRHDRMDPSFNNTFLLTYRSFTTAQELFEMLVKRFSIQPPQGISVQDHQIWAEKKQKLVRFRVVNVLKTWIDGYWLEPTGEVSNDLLRRILTFATDHIASTNTPGHQPLKASVEARLRGVDASNNKRLVLNLNTQAPQPIIPKNMKKLKFLDFDVTEFARQLTIIESRLYGKIKPSECLNKTWQKKLEAGEAEPAPNVKKLILHSNQLTNWVAEMILNQQDVKKRVAVIKHFVAVAEKCRLLNNFSTLMSIMTALNTASIHRLNRTWSQVNQRTMNPLENMRKVMASTRNFSEYREALHSANPPCIPFFGVYLTDLTFIEDGIPSVIKKTNLINFAKRAKTADVIRDIQQYQNVPYPLQPVPELQTYILDNMAAASDVHEMYEKSLQVEPREREDEKIARLLSESGFL